MRLNQKSALFLFIPFSLTLTECKQLWANQLIANGTTKVAQGTYDTGTNTPTAGYALYALNGGAITSNNALQLITGGNLAYGAYAQGVGASITIAAGSFITTNGEDAKGISAQSGGVVTVGDNSAVTTITTNGANADGLHAFLNNSTIHATNMSITTNNVTAHGVNANDASMVNITAASIVTNGVFSNGLYAIGTGNPTITASKVNVTVNGNSSTAAYALSGTIDLINSNLTVGTGAVGGWGAAAQNASTLTMTNGSITVNANSTTANRGRAVLVSSNGSATLNNVAISTAGANNYGAQALSGGSIALNGGSLNTTGHGNVALYATSSTSQRALINASNVAITTQQNDAFGAYVTNGGDINLTDTTISTYGQNAYGLYASLVGSAASGSIHVTGGSIGANNATAIVSNNTTLNTTLTNTTVTGNNALLSVINNGVINLDAHQTTLNGAALLDTATNASSSVSLFDRSTWNISDNSQVTTLVNNASTIHFTLPVNGVYKNLMVTNYSGNNGIIELNTLLHDSNSPSDLIVINNNGSATGTTNLVIRNTTGAGAATEGNGILVVDALSGATTTQTAFSLATPVVAGPFEYSLYRSGIDGDNQDNWYLRSVCPLTNPLCSPEPPNPPTPTPMDYRVETKIYSTLAATTLLYGQTLIGTLHERVGQDKWRDNSVNQGVWARMIGLHGARDRLNHHEINHSRYDYNFGGMQLGGDLISYTTAKGAQNHIGSFGAFGGSNGDVKDSNYTLGANQFTAYSLGGYWTHYSPEAAYIDTVVQATFYNNANSHSSRGLSLSTDGCGFAASVEGGYPLRLQPQWLAEPQAQLIYQTVHLNDTRDLGAQIRFRNNDALAGRLGLRFSNEQQFANAQHIKKLSVWLRPNLWYQFNGTPKAQFSSAYGYIPFQTELEGTSMEFNLGTTLELPKNTFLYANTSYSMGIGMHLNAYNGQLGFKVQLA